METKEYFEKVMQDFNQHRNGRSLRKYCQMEGIDYKWLQEYKKTYPNETYPRQGFTSLQPIKLYTSARLTEWMKERGCAIEAYFTDWKIDGELYPTDKK
jgi:hypothetical protein